MEIGNNAGAGASGVLSPFNAIQTTVPAAGGGNTLTAPAANTAAGWFDTILTDLGVGNRGRFEIERMKLKGVILNVTNMPINLRIYYCKWRNDEGTTGLTTLGGIWANYGITTDGLDQTYTTTPFMSSTFCSNIKILRSSTCRLGSGESKTLFATCPINRDTYLTKNNVQQQPIMERYTRGYLIFHYGSPVHSNITGASGMVTTHPSTVNVTWTAEATSRAFSSNVTQNATVKHFGAFQSGITATNLEGAVGNSNNPALVDTN